MMKHLFLSVISLLFTVSAIHAQVNNFGVSENGKLYWQKVYDVDISREDLLNIIINDGNFVDINDGDVITFRLIRGKLDVTEYGYSRGSVPMYVVNYDVSCFVTIQFKEGRYRTTADNIVLVRNLTTRMGREGEEEPVETWAVKNGKISSGFSKAPSEIYNAFFSNLFMFQKKAYLNDEW